MNGGNLRLFCYPLPDTAASYWMVPNLLLQKFPAEEFAATTKISFRPKLEGDKAGLMIFGMDYAYISLQKMSDGLCIVYSSCRQAEKGKPAQDKVVKKINGPLIYFKAVVTKSAICRVGYSEDGKNFTMLDEQFTAVPGKWVGAKLGLFCTSKITTNDAGFADIDWYRIDPI
jgi:beta-xylosidase